VEDDVFEMDRLAVDPRRRAGVGEVRALEPSFTDRRTASHLVESGSEQDGVVAVLPSRHCNMPR
jgi:hypothetical protein